MGLATFWLLPYVEVLPLVKQLEDKVFIETKEQISQIASDGATPVAVKERWIYPNLKLRVYTTGMRQNRLAKLVGIDEAYLSRIINGVRVPGKQMQEQIAQVLGCDAEWLFQQTSIQVPVAAFGQKLTPDA